MWRIVHLSRLYKSETETYSATRETSNSKDSNDSSGGVHIVYILWSTYTLDGCLPRSTEKEIEVIFRNKGLASVSGFITYTTLLF